MFITANRVTCIFIRHINQVECDDGNYNSVDDANTLCRGESTQTENFEYTSAMSFVTLVNFY